MNCNNINYNKDFQLWKKQALNKLDKSNIGKIDEKIKNLINIINNRNDMFSLSSCSGRICILNRNIDYKNKKQENIWIYLTHNECDYLKINNILDEFNDEKSLLEFRQESSILHICVLNYEIARKLMNIAKISGFNQVGIIANKSKIVVEIICDVILVIPIYDKLKLIDNDFLKYITKKANINQKLNWENILKLEKNILKL